MTLVKFLNATQISYSQSFTVTYSYENVIVYTMRSLGTATALIDMIVLGQPIIRHCSETFHYLLTMAIFDFLYLAPLLVTNLIDQRCRSSSTRCGEFMQYLAGFLVISIQNYLSSSFAIFNINLEIFITVQRAFMLAKKHLPIYLSFRNVVSLNLVISLLFYLPVAFQNKIEATIIVLNDGNVTEYFMTKTGYGLSLAGSIVPIILSSIRLILCGPVLLAVSLINIIYFHRHLRTKKALAAGRNKSTKSNKVNVLIVLTALLYMIGNFPYMIYYSISQIKPGFAPQFMDFMDWFSRFCLCSLIILKLPCFVIFNWIYRNELRRLICLRGKTLKLDSLETTLREHH